MLYVNPWDYWFSDTASKCEWVRRVWRVASCWTEARCADVSVSGCTIERERVEEMGRYCVRICAHVLNNIGQALSPMDMGKLACADAGDGSLYEQGSWFSALHASDAWVFSGAGSARPRVPFDTRGSAMRVE